MNPILLLLSLLLSLPISWAHEGHGKYPATTKKTTSSKAASLRLPALSTLARCSGGANCRACSNCNYCGYCAGGGGTCSVCADYSTPVRRAPRSSGGSYSSGRSTKSYAAPARPRTVLQVSGDYYVSATTLNLRAEPSADAAIVRVLDHNDVVTIDELTNAKWVKVIVSTSGGEVEGYLSRAYLSEAPSY